MVVARLSGSGKKSGVEVIREWAKVWTLRGGTNTRMDMCSNVGDALTAAGLREG